MINWVLKQFPKIKLINIKIDFRKLFSEESINELNELTSNLDFSVRLKSLSITDDNNFNYFLRLVTIF